jgi:signal transduction histidine kinase
LTSSWLPFTPPDEAEGPARSPLLAAQAGGGSAEALLGLAMEIGGSLDPRRVIRTILSRGARLARADRATLSSWRNQELTIEASAGAAGAGELSWAGRTYASSWLESQPLVRHALETGSVVIGGRLQVDRAAPEFHDALLPVQHTASVPVLHDGEVGGLLVLSRFSDPGFEEADRPTLATLGQIAGLALRNARAHQEAKETASRLAAAGRTRSELSEIAIHELRSPLTVIQGYAALLDNGDLGQIGGAARRAVRVVATKAREAQEIVTTLLTVARLDSDDLLVERIPFEVAPLLQRVRHRAAARATLARARLTSSAPPGLQARGDAELTVRILDNLVNNAITYSDAPARVHLSARREGDSVALRVQDWGIGIGDSERDRIFGRFVRGVGAERASGTGLGLYISRECAHRMGGDLQLETTALGEGSCFRLTLPAA